MWKKKSTDFSPENLVNRTRMEFVFFNKYWMLKGCQSHHDWNRCRENTEIASSWMSFSRNVMHYANVEMYVHVQRYCGETYWRFQFWISIRNFRLAFKCRQIFGKHIKSICSHWFRNPKFSDRFKFGHYQLHVDLCSIVANNLKCLKFFYWWLFKLKWQQISWNVVICILCFHSTQFP